jgi:membrane protein implicated in regulation of membrane protease activity
VTTPTRYFLLQVPGWGLAAILLAALHRWFGIPLWVAWGGWALFVIKDFVLYPYLRPAYETTSPSGAERLNGQVGVVTRPLEPEGYVRLGGELWQARTVGQQVPIPVGGRVRVEGADGLVLIVAPVRRQTTDPPE